MNSDLKFGFVTCVQLGFDVLEEIYRLGGRVDLCVTLPDDTATGKSGRVHLDEFCERNRVPLIKAASVNAAEVEQEVRNRGLDWLFIIGWSQIAKAEILKAPTYGCIGMHPTLLPEGRGRASIPWAILKELPETGVTMFQLDEGVDTGPTLAQVRIPLSPETNASDLYDEVQAAHRQLIRENWADLCSGSLAPSPQDLDSGSFWPGRKPEDGELLADMSVDEALRLVRATTKPYPGAFWTNGPTRTTVWRARRREAAVPVGPIFSCRDGQVEALEYETLVNSDE